MSEEGFPEQNTRPPEESFADKGYTGDDRPEFGQPPEESPTHKEVHLPLG